MLLFAHHHDVMDIYRQELRAFHPGFNAARDGDFPSESAGVQFGCVLSDLFPFLSVVACLLVLSD